MRRQVQREESERCGRHTKSRTSLWLITAYAPRAVCAPIKRRSGYLWPSSMASALLLEHVNVHHDGSIKRTWQTTVGLWAFLFPSIDSPSLFRSNVVNCMGTPSGPPPPLFRRFRKCTLLISPWNTWKRAASYSRTWNWV